MPRHADAQNNTMSSLPTNSSINPADLSKQRILLGICGGIAAYKTPNLVRELRKMGAEVEIVMTENATRFVSPMALQAVNGKPVRDKLWDEQAEAAMGHIELARWAHTILIAPATANTLAKLAQGLADDLLTTLCLASDAQVAFAPAMNQAMFLHPRTQANLQTLQADGYQMLGPGIGEQACGDHGPGRMLEPEEIAQSLASNQAVTTLHAGKLKGQQVLITAGPTVEAIDPVRFISNHSSGKQGLCVAQAAYDAGAQVTLIAGPGVGPVDTNIKRVDVVSALDMQAAVQAHLADATIFIGVAAVADYRPVKAQTQKIKRNGDEKAGMQVALVENPDIIAGVAKSANRPALVIGFAAETNNTLEHAQNKLTRKGLDAIVLNDVSNPEIGFNSNNNAVIFIHHTGRVNFPQQSKQLVANTLISQIYEQFSDWLVSINLATVTK